MLAEIGILLYATINIAEVDLDKAINILGALSMVLTDEVREAVDGALGTAGETGAAIIMIGAHPGLSIGEVAKALNLTPSGAVRAIDRLEADGLVVRSAASDNRRSVVLELTKKGQKKREIALRQRDRVLRHTVSHLTDAEVSALETIMDKVLQRKLTQRDHQCYRICRMCDEQACVPNCCPIEERWAELFGREERLALP